MLAGFAAAFLIGDMFLAVRGAATTSVEFLYGVAGFSLAQVFWTLGQLREARPDIRVFFAAAVPLSLFVICRLHPPVLPAAANAAVCVYSVLTALSFATALATRRAFYVCGIGLLLFSDLMIGGGLVRMPGCNALIGPAYIAAILVARFRKGVDLAWTVWFVVLVIVFALCLDLKAIPFSPYVTTTQKLLIVSFAVWAGSLAWRTGGKSAS